MALLKSGGGAVAAAAASLPGSVLGVTGVAECPVWNPSRSRFLLVSGTAVESNPACSLGEGLPEPYSSCGRCFGCSYSGCSPNAYGTLKPEESTLDGFQTLLNISLNSYFCRIHKI